MSKLTKPTRTQWFSLETLGALINRHRVDDSTSRAIKKIMRADLICIDLCRHGDYADPSVAGHVCALVSDGLWGSREVIVSA